MLAYNAEQSRIYYSYAGHFPALLWRRRTNKWQPLELGSTGGPANTPLGVLPSTRFDQEETVLDRGDRVVLYTDGVVESANLEGEECGLRRLEGALGCAGGESLAAIKTRVIQAVGRHVAPAAFQDDLTLILVEVL